MTHHRDLPNSAMNKPFAALAGSIIAFFLATFAAAAQDSVTTNLQGIGHFPTYDQAFTNSDTRVPGIAIIGPSFLHTNDVKSIVAPYLGKPLGDDTLRAIQTNIVLLCRKVGHPVVDVCYPEAPVMGGVVPLAVIEGRLDRLIVTNNRWYAYKNGSRGA